MKQNGDIRKYVPLVLWVCRQQCAPWSMQDDLVQEGLLGVLEAMQHYEEGRGAQFETYAVYWIRKRVQAALEQERRQSLQDTIPLEHVPTEQLVCQTAPEEGWFENLIGEKQHLLSEQEVRVLRMLYEDEKAVKDVARELGISRARVLMMKRRILRVLREEMQ